MKYLLAISFLLFFTASVRAQTLSMPDLVNLANLNNSEAGNFLVQAKAFKLMYTQEVDGLDIDHYQSSGAKQEMVVIGNGIKTPDGKLLHTVKYTCGKARYVLSLIVQASATGLSMNFQGADATKNIYLFDNFLYSVNIYINNDNSAGSIDVQQKDYGSYF